MFQPRPYQTAAITAGVNFFGSNTRKHAFEILPTGSGKSVVIANICKELNGKSLVLQPSKEILHQNHRKFLSYGYRAGIYSASAGQKAVNQITFATIGSIIRKKYLFKEVENILIDECHLVNPADGMYSEFIASLPKAKVLGLTATPYRLTSSFEGAMLEFLNRTTPRIFTNCLYYVQNAELFNAGHLAKLEYYSFDVVDRSQLEMNAQGTDFTESSIRAYYRRIDMPKLTVKYANELLKKRKNLLVFCSLVSEATKVTAGIPGAVLLTGETEQQKRDQILSAFKAGRIRCVVNVGVLTTGFDYPELDTVLLCRSTMSLALYYQIVGRAMRPHPGKESAWIVDLGGNISFFGKVEDLQIRTDGRGNMAVWSKNRQLTNVTFTKN